MAVRIRLSLRGCLNRPFYHIVVVHSKRKRDGKPLEQVIIFLRVAISLILAPRV